MFSRCFGAVFICCLISSMASMPALAEVKSSTDKIADAFMELDFDETESVSFEEYSAMVELRAIARFEEMDANQDGEVTDAEYREFWRKNKAKWYRLQR